MRYWIYVEPVSADSSEPVYTIMGDNAILDSYYNYWIQRMLDANAKIPNNISDTLEQCILDWATVHWAVEVTPLVLREFTMGKRWLLH